LNGTCSLRARLGLQGDHLFGSFSLQSVSLVYWAGRHIVEMRAANTTRPRESTTGVIFVCGGEGCGYCAEYLPRCLVCPSKVGIPASQRDWQVLVCFHLEEPEVAMKELRKGCQSNWGLYKKAIRSWRDGSINWSIHESCLLLPGTICPRPRHFIAPVSRRRR
jgi:hypothetical protein